MAKSKTPPQTDVLTIPVGYGLVPGRPAYRVGDDGSVWTRWKRVGLGDGGGTRMEIGTEWRRMKTNTNLGGYLSVELYPDRQRMSVQRLVLETFVGPRPEGMEAAHENGIKTDNRRSNLKWKTKEENDKDKDRHGTRQRGERVHTAKFTAAEVLAIRAENKAGKSCAQIGRERGATKSSIHRIVTRRSWSHVS